MDASRRGAITERRALQKNGITMTPTIFYACYNVP